jgi:LL-diaminopimelate aminotransferase
MKRANRLNNMPPYPFARWSAHIRAAQARGMDVIRLDMGNPDLPPSDEVIEALCLSARHPDHHGYPGFRGLPAMREAVAGYYERRFGVTLAPETEVVLLIGSKEGIIHIAMAHLDPGDLALVPDPGYAPYTLGTAMAGAEVLTFPLLPERGFLPDLDSIPAAAADKAVLMWLNYPNNPTGATASLEFLARAVDFARRHDLLLCHDAPYADVAYDGYVAPSLLQVPGAAEVAIIDSGVFRPLQEAAVQALSTHPKWIAARNQVYRKRLDIILGRLAELDMAGTLPRAALYIWARVPPGWRSEPFALALLERTGVAIAPGSFFGPAGEGYVRISATAPTKRVEEAMGRFGRSAKSIRALDPS